jgi:hypothetical protein
MTNDWIFTREEIENTPSRADGISLDREMRDRARGAADINFLAQKLQLGCDIIASASILFQRFYMLKSLKNVQYHGKMGNFND